MSLSCRSCADTISLRKDEYLRLLGKAGFREVRIVQENRYDFPVEAGDSRAGSIAEEFHIPVGTLREAARAILSVQVFGRKPAQADFVKP